MRAAASSARCTTAWTAKLRAWISFHGGSACASFDPAGNGAHARLAHRNGGVEHVSRGTHSHGSHVATHDGSVTFEKLKRCAQRGAPESMHIRSIDSCQRTASCMSGDFQRPSHARIGNRGPANWRQVCAPTRGFVRSPSGHQPLLSFSGWKPGPRHAAYSRNGSTKPRPPQSWSRHCSTEPPPHTDSGRNIEWTQAHRKVLADFGGPAMKTVGITAWRGCMADAGSDAWAMTRSGIAIPRCFLFRRRDELARRAHRSSLTRRLLLLVAHQPLNFSAPWAASGT